MATTSSPKQFQLPSPAQLNKLPSPAQPRKISSPAQPCKQPPPFKLFHPPPPTLPDKKPDSSVSPFGARRADPARSPEVCEDSENRNGLPHSNGPHNSEGENNPNGHASSNDPRGPSRAPRPPPKPKSGTSSNYRESLRRGSRYLRNIFVSKRQSALTSSPSSPSPPALPPKSVELMYDVPRPTPSTLKLPLCFKIFCGENEISYRSLWFISLMLIVAMATLGSFSTFYYVRSCRLMKKNEYLAESQRYYEIARPEIGTEQCYRVTPCSRLSCAEPRTSAADCHAKGCCFQAGLKGVPECFYSEDHLCNRVKPFDREHCVDDRFRQRILDAGRSNCETQSNCCYDDSVDDEVPDLVKCYKKPNSDSDLVNIACGTRHVYQDPDAISGLRVVGGEDAQDGAFPWAALVQLEDEPHCGATVIDRKWALTAAHCFDDFYRKETRLSQYTVHVGMTNWKQPGENHQKLEIEEIIKHPDYRQVEWLSADYMRRDVALLKVKSIKFTFFVRPACLPTSDNGKVENLYKEGRRANIAGWGRTSSARFSESAQHLQVTTVLLIPPLPCRDLYRANADPRYARLAQAIDSEEDVCAGYARGGRDTCQGDSGGPLSVVETHINVVVGVTSFGGKCAGENAPGVYTNVHANLNWILEQMEE